LPPSSPPPPTSTPDSETEDFSAPPRPSPEPQTNEPIRCNQGSDEISDFTCSLCIQAHISSGIDSLLNESSLFSHVVSYLMFPVFYGRLRSTPLTSRPTR
jgi:hypothetical protein